MPETEGRGVPQVAHHNDAGLLVWGVGAAAIPGHLPGPGGAPILPAGYQGYSGCSWHQLAATSPQTAGYITLVFRMYGIYIAAFALLAVAIAATAFRRGDRRAWWALLVGNTVAFVSAMTYDRIVGAIGPFEWSEYLGLAVIYAHPHHLHHLGLHRLPRARRGGPARRPDGNHVLGQLPGPGRLRSQAHTRAGGRAPRPPDHHRSGRVRRDRHGAAAHRTARRPDRGTSGASRLLPGIGR
jgi:hypothetical protein